MSFTPFVRWRNFNLKNLKALLSIFPDLNGNVSRNEVLEDLEANLKGYKRTAYQFAMQFGLECKAENFTENTYLHYFDDEKLEQYLRITLLLIHMLQIRMEIHKLMYIKKLLINF